MNQRTHDLLSTAGKATLGALLIGAFVAAPNPATASVAITNLLAVAGAIGGDLVTNAAGGLVRHWSGGRLPHPLARAYSVALRKAVVRLKSEYRQQYGKEAEIAAFELLMSYSSDLTKIDLPALHLNGAQASQYVHDGIDELLYAHEERQVAYLRDRLLVAIADELPRVLDQDEEAARRFQVWLLEDLQAGQRDLQQELREGFRRVIEILDRHLSQGSIGRLRLGQIPLLTRHDAYLSDFLQRYIGTPDALEPFGGRESNLADYTRWLDDPTAPPYALLIAPAGRGKSAVLAHWVQRTERRDEVAVVFWPISHTYANTELGVFSALYARVAHLYGDLPIQATSVDEYRGAFQDYMARPLPDGRRLLVVLDGLDEAAGWKPGKGLFPAMAPPHLKILVAAREIAGDIDWATRLGWNNPKDAVTFGLEALSLNDLVEILKDMGDPLARLQAKVGFVDKLHELCDGGDPLLVGLYINALRQDRGGAPDLQPEDLEGLEPGLQKFFAAWFESQESRWIADKGAVDQLIEALATAHGPLSAEDLLRLVPTQFTGTSAVRRTAELLQRFLVGNGDHRSGYSFGHPRLAEYFRKRLSAPERKIWQDRYLAYGASTLTDLESGLLEPEDASEYVVRYYRLHLLAQPGSPALLCALMCKGWLLAWRALEDTEAGFLDDVQAAMERAAVAGPEWLGQVARGTLCVASVSSLSARIEWSVLTAAVRVGELTLPIAATIAMRHPDPAQRAENLIALAELADTTTARPMCLEALRIAGSIVSPFEASQATHTIATRLLAKPRFLLTEAVQGLSEDSWVYGPDLKSAIALIPDGDLDLLREALQASRFIPYEDSRVDALEACLARLPEDATDLVEPALSVVTSLSTLSQRTRALTAIAERWSSPKTQPLLEEALDGARSLEHATQRAHALTRLARCLPFDQARPVLEEALRAARTIGTGEHRVDALVAIARQMPEPASLLREALTNAFGLEDEIERAKALTTLVEHLPEDARSAVIKEAQATARRIADPESRARWLAANAVHSEEKDADLLWAEVRQAISAVPLAKLNSWVLAEIVARFPRPTEGALLLQELLHRLGSLADMRQRLRSISEIINCTPRESVELLAEIIQALGEVCRPDQLDPGMAQAETRLDRDIDTVAATFADGDRARAIGAIASRLPLDDLHLWTQLLQVSDDIQSDRAHADALIAIVQSLEAGQANPVLAVALEKAKSLTTPPDRARAIAAVALKHPTRKAREFIRQALSSVRVIDDHANQAHALSSAARLLPALSPHPLWVEVFRRIDSIADEAKQAETLCKVLSRLPQDLKGSFLGKALACSKNYTDPGWRVKVLCAIAAQLPTEEAQGTYREAVAVARSYPEEKGRASALSTLIQALPDSAAAWSFGVADDSALILSLQAATTALPEALVLGFESFLEDARFMLRSTDQIEVITAVATRLPVGRAVELLKSALTQALAIVDPPQRARALRDIVNRWPRLDIGSLPDLRVESYDLAAELSSLHWVAGFALVVDSAARRPRGEAEAGLTDALELARSMSGDYARALAIFLIAIRLPEHPESLWAEALKIAELIPSTNMGERENTLINMASCLPRRYISLLRRVWEAALPASDRPVIPRVFGELADSTETIAGVTGQSESHLLADMLTAMAHAQRAEVLDAFDLLLPTILRVGGKVALDDTLKAILETAEWWP